MRAYEVAVDAHLLVPFGNSLVLHIFRFQDGWSSNIDFSLYALAQTILSTQDVRLLLS